MDAALTSSREMVPGSGRPTRWFQLDGWRGISICCVLAAHLLPLGPARFQLNRTAGAMGMCLFFSLSGFLITSFLLEHSKPLPFLVRRFCRILPLAWLFMAVSLVVTGSGPGEAFANFAFLLNYQDQYLHAYNSHMWSLCVEMHFYLFVAALVALLGKNGLYCLPIVCLAVTLYRVVQEEPFSNVTHLRVDEILAGATLALIFCSQRINARIMFQVPTWIAVVVLVVCCNPFSAWLEYLRPYAGAWAIGTTLVQPDARVSQWLKGRLLFYIASISYAAYVIHGPLRTGWFAGSDSVDRYLFKRPLTIALTFLLAHISTFYWEAWWIKLGKRLTSRRTTEAPNKQAV